MQKDKRKAMRERSEERKTDRVMREREREIESAEKENKGSQVCVNVRKECKPNLSDTKKEKAIKYLSLKPGEALTH